ncbi:MAG: TlpA family protein disulfide reductase [Deltaproteobacteria bacterium]|nr:TlpA family protein disulfide reductase [Deltaproteobacteria bacterium]
MASLAYCLIFSVIVFLSPSFCLSADDSLWKHAGIEKLKPVLAQGFTLPDTNGKPVSLEDLRGKVVLLNFWATWCPPCKAEMPSLETLHRLLGKKGLSIIAIDDYESKNKTLDFLKENKYTFTILIDEEGIVSEKYLARVLPTTFIIDRQGMLIGRALGERRWDDKDITAFFEELLK